MAKIISCTNCGNTAHAKDTNQVCCAHCGAGTLVEHEPGEKICSEERKIAFKKYQDARTEFFLTGGKLAD